MPERPKPNNESITVTSPELQTPLTDEGVATLLKFYVSEQAIQQYEPHTEVRF